MSQFYYVINAFIAMQMITSAVMCVFGYKWSRGLIATMSSYVGGAIGVFVSILLFERGAGIDVLIIVPVIAFLFSIMAYKIVLLNHFLAGFLLAVKISFMIVVKMYQNSMIENEVALLVLPLLIGCAGGVLTCMLLNKYILIACVSFVGATELVPKVFELVNKTLFITTGNIDFIFDPTSFFLSLFGISIPSGMEVVFILLIGGIGFYFQKWMFDASGEDLSKKVVDDRNL